jgi:PHP family Zn ribbon phosphoesterase
MPDLPALPDQYIEQALKLSTDNNDVQSHSGVSKDNPGENPYAYRREVKRNSVTAVSRTHVRFNVSDEIEQWVYNNISQEFSSVGVSVSVGELSDFNSPHTDVTRSYVLIYLLNTSNTDQDTVFWHEPGKTLRRKRKTFSYDLDSLIKVDSVRIPLHQWCYIDATILHSVENIENHRVALQVSFDCDPFEIF